MSISSENLQNFEDFTIVWLYGHPIEREIFAGHGNFLRAFVNSFKQFDDASEFLNYMLSIKTYREAPKTFIGPAPVKYENIFVVLPNAYNERLTKRIHDLSHVEQIYIYNDCDAENLWTKKYLKVRGPYSVDDLQDMFDTIAYDVRCALNNLLPITIFDRESTEFIYKDLTPEQLDFLWFQVLLRTLQDTPVKQTIKEIIDEYKSHFTGSIIKEALMEDFAKSYSKGNAIHFYSTNKVWLSTILNKACRMEVIEILYKFRFVFQDIRTCCVKLQKTFKEQTLTVYRQQFLTIFDLDKLSKNIGKLISFNNFFFASTEEYFDKDFESHYGSACGQYEKALRYLTIVCNEHPPESSEDSVIYQNIGAVYYKVGEYELALKYFQKYLDHRLKNTAATDLSLESIYADIATIYSEMKMLDEGLKYCDMVISMQSGELKDSTDEDLMRVFIAQGSCLQRKFESKLAQESNFKALEIALRVESENSPLLGALYNNIASCYLSLREYKLAVKYHKKGLKIKKNYLPANHPSIATSYHNIGVVYLNQGWLINDSYLRRNKIEDAIDNFKKCLNIQLQTLPEDHPHVVATLHYLQEAKEALVLPGARIIIGDTEIRLGHSQLLQFVQSLNKSTEATDQGESGN
ncbi:unnamed protein product [Rotaria sordida]|uniref:Uncharacterized protein n=1 Tax=Rotaria sordida TaxID=392033 RepID=A0A815KD87_9BILA|nr:unnamed protein product [Rotaria sordida]CAF1394080.1 unnamed protein product [Rotaria sordida]